MPPDHRASRESLIEFLRAELVGPAPVGKPIDCNREIIFTDAPDAYRPRIQEGSAEEILQRDPPGRRYGIGVLCPLGIEPDADEPEPEAADLGEAAPVLLADSAAGDLNRIAERQPKALGAEEEEFDLSSANEYRASAMALSFLVNLGGSAGLRVTISAGRYHRKKIQVAGQDRTWWLRVPVSSETVFESEELCADGNCVVSKRAEGDGLQGLDVRVEVFSRPRGSRHLRLLTVCLLNRTPARSPVDEVTLFQVAVYPDS